ncbi:HAD-IA family hydrolase [Actinoplanes sp. L3-i22]|uniref:HAD-IA family hydrolase n=1 Tax=Actinoplanes sp. L3-i22 TaxID=2836373 RepID=UPI001C774B58|nr:HAD-IA family hydrolase [Actinoplanes sp. L3-i22]BCY11180.1 phosphatase [Actinoplanes sp. L3-i22]
MTALIFDCDGVLADTERDGHLPAFNATFERYGLPVRWSEAEYGRRLRIGGGKERLASLFTDGTLGPIRADGTLGPIRADGTLEQPEADTVGGPSRAMGGGGPRGNVAPAGMEGARAAAIAAWHRTKTEIFRELVSAGRIPARPGIARIIGEAVGAGWTVAVASTSAEVSVRAVLAHAVGAELAGRIPVFAGDVVPAKKPDPAIYRLTVRSLALDPAATLVIEDSRNGLLAAIGAGLTCVVTVNDYTRDEDFGEAALVVSELGDPDRPPIDILANRGAAKPGDFLTLDDLRACLPERGFS